MQALIKDFLNQRRFAVVGSFRNPGKYAYQILVNLKNKGYRVYPVNPGLKEVEGLKCYASVKDIPAAVDVVDIVTPPKITREILTQCKQKKISRIWLQPGAESQEAIRFCRENSMQVIYGLCLMLEDK